MSILKQLKYYPAVSKISEISEESIFRSLSNNKKFSLCTRIKLTSYSRMREVLLKSLKAVILDWKNYGIHSLRWGGISLVAHNGVSDRLFKWHGRRKSDEDKVGYIEDSLESLLSVSKNLAAWYSPPKFPLILVTRKHGSTSRKISFSLIQPVDKENK